MKFVNIIIGALVGLTAAHRTVEDPDEQLLNREHDSEVNLDISGLGSIIPEVVTDYALLQKFSDETEFKQRGII